MRQLITDTVQLPQQPTIRPDTEASAAAHVITIATGSMDQAIAGTSRRRAVTTATRKWLSARVASPVARARLRQ